MKNLFLISLFIFSALSLMAQNIGINNTDPNVSLDISGAIAHRSVVVQPFQNNVNVPVNITYFVIGNVDVTGNVNVVDGEPWIDGRRLVIFNSTGFSATFNGVTLLPNETKEFICKAPIGGWQLISGGSSSSNPDWSTIGNTGTNPATHFLGTSDANDLIVKTNNEERLRLDDTTTTLKFSSQLLDTNSIVMSNIDPVGSVNFRMSSYLNPFPSLNFSSKGLGQASYINQQDILNLGWDGYVGLGTHTGNGKLTINHRTLGQSLPSIAIIDSSLNNTSGGILQFSNIYGTPNLNLHGHIGNSSTGDDSYFLFSRSGNYLMRLTGDGMLGIGVNDPSSKLDVGGEIGIRGNNRLELGKGILPKETNAGTIAYKLFSDALDIIGAGENSDLTDRKVKIWAEGGTEMNGDIQVNADANINGTLKFDGDAGTTGQVLISNGPNMSPAWQNPPCTNNVRFAVNIPLNTTGDLITFEQLYNTAPSDVTISAAAITINKTGLYRINGVLYNEILFSGVPVLLNLNVYLFADGIEFDLLSLEPMKRSPWSSDNLIEETYVYNLPFSMDVYVTTPGTIDLGRHINFGMGGNPGGLHSRKTFGKLSGYLISE